MKVVAMQPRYLPHISYISKIIHSDCFVVLDDVQHNKSIFETRNKYFNINTKDTGWLTLPTEKINSRPLINELRIKDDDFINNHILTIQRNLSKSKYFDYDFIKKVIRTENQHKSFVGYAVEHINIIVKYLGLQMPKVIYSSSIDTQGATKDNKIIKILEWFNDKDLFYIAGVCSSHYISDFPFSNGYSSDKYEYKSINGEYVPYLNIIDTICNIGIENTVKMIKESTFEN